MRMKLSLGFSSNVAATGGGGAPTFTNQFATGHTQIAVSNGGLTATNSGGPGNNRLAITTNSASSGYFEVFGATNSNVGVGLTSASQSDIDWVGNAYGIQYGRDGNVYRGGAPLITGYATYDLTTDRVSVCVKAGKLYFAKNGTWQGGANPSAGTGGIDINSYTDVGFPAAAFGDNGSIAANFGQSAFTYAVPTGVPAGW